MLAATAGIGALVFAIVWDVCAIRRTLADHRRQVAPAERVLARARDREHPPSRGRDDGRPLAVHNDAPGWTTMDEVSQER